MSVENETCDMLAASWVLGDLKGWQAASETSWINHGVDACEGLWVLLTEENQGGQKSPGVAL